MGGKVQRGWEQSRNEGRLTKVAGDKHWAGLDRPSLNPERADPDFAKHVRANTAALHAEKLE